MIRLKHFSIFCLGISALVLAPYTAFSQQNPAEGYTQRISGTDLAFEMVPIPSGDFKMGSPDGEQGRDKDEGPQHLVRLNPFWMGKYEVTWDIFEPFVYKDFEITQSNGTVSAEVDAVTRPTKPYLDMTFGMGKENHPAVGMTQYAAIQFCKWLYTRTGVFYRLPTEAEWEYASRAGTTTAYAFGDAPSELGEHAWYQANSNKETHPVGSKKPNAWGLYDMHGNVAEWTQDQYIPDFYGKLKGKPVANPIAVPEKLYPHVVRGGSFMEGAEALRAANREGSDPSWKRIDPQIPKSNWWFPEAPFVGFRLVRPATPPSKADIDTYYNQPPTPDY
ncbi:formylglycine-generating enzyme family protein [Pontibacter sp. E15-1]|uniref:formylglycine-generating enzyme family protein n=1 Tax=Pontibacter sp. E15-1 TaxID=2919918 RepID=UPI001F50007B|nr:formylglycine-generating enzyme family protein [Pontibacter sp. E15-1]MCJ8167185.1 formylglycine-generating enzyme family protein [Pontibacter sp. E15-1]